MTKKQKRTRAAAGARKRGLAKAVRSLLKKANPSAKITGAKVVKLKGGALRITPIKDNPSVRKSKKALKAEISRILGSKRGLKGLGGDKEYWMVRSAAERRRR